MQEEAGAKETKWPLEAGEVSRCFLLGLKEGMSSTDTQVLAPKILLYCFPQEL